MFTGIIEHAGQLARIVPGLRNTKLSIRTGKIGRSLRDGSSLAVNGACLTVVRARADLVHFDVLEETLRRTNLGALRPGDLVNLERPMRADARFDGHFVLGHVDATGRVRRFARDGQDYILEVTAPAAITDYVVDKGSIAVDGISLTVAGAGRTWFRVCIIPHTLATTNLRERRVGDRVNLEADIIGKYVEKLLNRHKSQRG